jgi:acyl carrier protein
MRCLACILAVSVGLGCKSSDRQDSSQRAATVAKVRNIVAEVLGVAPADIPTAAPLSKLPKPPDDLDVVEIVLAMEEHFHVEIPDEAVVRAAGGESSSGLGGQLTVEKLADLVKSPTGRQ